MNRTAGPASQASSSRWSFPFESTASTASLAGHSSSSSQAGQRVAPRVHASTPRSAADLSLGHIEKPRSRDDFTIAIFCALTLEADLVDAFFTERWPVSDYGKAPGDTNTYTLGLIGGLNVVLVHLGHVGKVSAAIAAASCHRSFLEIRLALVVGICGGVPGDAKGATERILGDVIISESLVQFDFGRQYPGQFVHRDKAQDNLRGPNDRLRRFLARVKARDSRELREETWNHLCRLQGSRDYHQDATYPGAHRDILYESSYIHRHHDPQMCHDWARTCGTPRGSCAVAKGSHCEALNCDHSRLVPRGRLRQSSSSSSSQGAAAIEKPAIHFGMLASGDTVMKSGLDRDEIAEAQDIIAFEMEGAGVWDLFPCVVIKGICDYADSHKSKIWQNYAAATAGACMAAFLDEWARNN